MEQNISFEKEEFLKQHPEINHQLFNQAYSILCDAFYDGHMVYTLGMGEQRKITSHFASELMTKSKLHHQIAEGLRHDLMHLDSKEGTYISDHLETALPCVDISSLNDTLNLYQDRIHEAGMMYPQMAMNLIHKGDVLLLLNEKGKEEEAYRTLLLAKTKEAKSIVLASEKNSLFSVSDCALVSQDPSSLLEVYNLMLEDYFFADMEL